MDSWHEEVHKLLESTEQTRRQFLKVDADTCDIAVEKARLELSLGNPEEARKEHVMASRGADVIERLLGDARQELPEIRERLKLLRDSLEALRQEIAAFSR
jgi:hypothetical protein